MTMSIDGPCTSAETSTPLNAKDPSLNFWHSSSFAKNKGEIHPDSVDGGKARQSISSSPSLCQENAAVDQPGGYKS